MVKHPNYYLSEHSYPSEQQPRAFEEDKFHILMQFVFQRLS